MHETRRRRWGFAPAAMWVPGAGCDGLQVDGENFSEVIVLQVVVTAR